MPSIPKPNNFGYRQYSPLVKGIILIPNRKQYSKSKLIDCYK